MIQLMENIVNKRKVYENLLSEFATKSDEAIYLKEKVNSKDETRLSFNHDTDKILYSSSYARYSGKTQVHTASGNDMISTRATHVQYVAHIARNIARSLNLNEDLCEAMALGHDLGHTPFGHVGEKILNKISIEKLGIAFNHNIQSVRTLMYIENKGRGLNISLQVLDGIMCHNGELLLNEYKPKNKDIDMFLNEFNNSYTDDKVIKKMIPMTLEGCVVRVSDIIAYLGKDIEDAIRLNKFSLNNLNVEIKEKLGSTNSQIISTIILDIINNSYEKGYIKMSDEIFNLVRKTLSLNYENIYSLAESENSRKVYELMFYQLYDVYLHAIKDKKLNNDIYIDFLNDKCDEYNINTKDEVKVIDFLAGMTDKYFLSEYHKYSKFNKK